MRLLLDVELIRKHTQLTENSISMMNMRTILTPLNDGRLMAKMMQQMARKMIQIEPVIGRHLKIEFLLMIKFILAQS